ncbi:MAG: hypothetical protein CVV50_00860 [Spirochaetae bacterium HGW-Spirochaetae-6]|nr:MAG: hypothetical protein CVV50_00860 [Spirochaetae bacterium HGW-Spirochaetae-6]
MDQEIKKIVKPVLIILVLIVLFTTILYFLAKWEGITDVTILKSLYMVVITLSTVGYGDLFESYNSSLLTSFYTFTIITYMVAVAYAVSNFTAFLIEGRLRKFFQYKKTLKRINKMTDHYIICGIKDIGVFVAKELDETKRPFVIIEESTAAVELLRKELPNIVVIEGDATEDHILIEAGIKRAKALVASLDNDKENLYLVVAAKELNRQITLAAKFYNPKTVNKLRNAGAHYLVSPNMIGGLRIASELIRPQVVSFLDRMLRGKKSSDTRVEEVIIPENSVFVGRSLYSIYKESSLLVISYAPKVGEDFEYNPDPNMKIEAGMVLIMITSPEQRLELEKKIQTT